MKLMPITILQEAGLWMLSVPKLMRYAMRIPIVMNS
jgi:hypothetical protein